MAVTANGFFNGVDLAVLTSWTGAGRFKMALFNTQPALSTSLYSSLTGEVANGNGYTTGGISLSGLSPTHVVTAAASWGTSWVTATPYVLNNIVKSSGVSGYLFRCCVAGTSGGSAPTQATEGALDTSSTGAQFVNAGQSIEVWSSSNVVWTASGGSIGPAQWAVIYDSTTSANLFLISFGASQTATNGNTLTVSPDASLGWFSTIPQ
jgi:hypothetical protein